MSNGSCASRGAQGSWPGSGPEPLEQWGAVPYLGTTRGITDDLMLETVAFARGSDTGASLRAYFRLYFASSELLTPFLREILGYPFGDKGGLKVWKWKGEALSRV